MASRVGEVMDALPRALLSNLGGLLTILIPLPRRHQLHHAISLALYTILALADNSCILPGSRGCRAPHLLLPRARKLQLHQHLAPS